jgi:hypothetical protein
MNTGDCERSALAVAVAAGSAGDSIANFLFLVQPRHDGCVLAYLGVEFTLPDSAPNLVRENVDNKNAP